MINFRICTVAAIFAFGFPAAAQATVVLNPLVQLTSHTWKITGSCSPNEGSVKVKVRLAGTTGPATTMATGNGQCKNSGLGKSYVLDMTGKASGVWDVALKQGANVSGIQQITVP